MTTVRAVASACGHYLPDKVVTNDDLAKSLDTSDEWIRARTGIGQRHIAADGQLTSDLAVRAADRTLAAAGIDASRLDAIILATATPDQTFPSTATRVQHALGMTRGFAFDIQAVCAGFIFALANGNSMIQSGMADRVMVIGAETFSRILDWDDRSTAVLFGDGAGAVILERADGTGLTSDRGILSVCLHSDGEHNRILYVSGGPSETQQSGFLKMEGREVFKHAVVKLAAVAEEVIGKAGLSSDDVDWIVPHQANLRIIESTAKKTRIPMDKVIVTVQDHGNTSAASIPLALSCGSADGRIRRGQLLLMEAIGGGLAWGAALLRW